MDRTELRYPDGYNYFVYSRIPGTEILRQKPGATYVQVAWTDEPDSPWSDSVWSRELTDLETYEEETVYGAGDWYRPLRKLTQEEVDRLNELPN